MDHTTLKKCSVILKPCPTNFKDCYVSLEKANDGPKPKKCVSIEPSTPKAEPALTAELRNAINEKNILTQKTKTKFISALNELEEANKKSDKRCRKLQASQEIIDSEVTYLKQLGNIINFFKKPLADSDILLGEDVDKLFGTISTIYNVNEELLRRLQENPTNVGEAFAKIAPFLKLYSAYAYDYKMILNILQKAEENVEFSKFLRNQETRPEVQCKLSSLLITPIQRIPRYCLLLKQVLINTSPMEDDFEIIKDSLRKVEESAEHVNQLVADRENSVLLLQIQDALQSNTPVIIKPGRKLIKEGEVVKMLGAKMTRMYLVAMTDILMFCKIRKDNVRSKNALKSAIIFPLHKCAVRQNPTSRNVEIRCENETVMLYVEKIEDFDEWVKILKASALKCRRNRLTLHKESSTRRPAFNKEVGAYSEIGISPGVPQRKRKIVENELVLRKNYFTEATEYKSYVPLVSKRKCLHEHSPPDDPMEINHSNDVLYPLRHHYLPPSTVVNFESKEAKSEKDEVAEEVFVFGRPENENRGFNFSLANLCSVIGNSFKKLFGFK